MVYILRFVIFCIFSINFVRSQCAFPCSRQNVTNDGLVPGIDAIYGTQTDKTILQVFDANTVLAEFYCVSRSGPFYLLRENNGTHDLYRCNKDVIYKQAPEIIVLYKSQSKYYGNRPTMSEVCNGVDLVPLIVKDKDIGIGCNIPSICPVTRPGQIQCSACEISERNDDGLACDCQ